MKSQTYGAKEGCLNHDSPDLGYSAACLAEAITEVINARIFDHRSIVTIVIQRSLCSKQLGTCADYIRLGTVEDLSIRPGV